MLTRHVALVAEAGDVPFGELSSVAAALQVQVARDFAPLWSVDATVAAFEDRHDVPLGWWHVIIRNRAIDSDDDYGYHTDRRRQPYSLLKYTHGWTLTASHEILEMLADPFGSRLVAGPSIDPRDPGGRVEYLLEVCDPCEDTPYAYTVNGVMVSDFITPHYHDPAESSGARYSFTGSIKHPRQLLPGGYISYDDPKTGHMLQATMAKNGHVTFDDLGKTDGSRALREYVHERARALALPSSHPRHIDAADASVRVMEERAAGARLASRRSSDRFEKDIARAAVAPDGHRPAHRERSAP